MFLRPRRSQVGVSTSHKRRLLRLSTPRNLVAALTLTLVGAYLTWSLSAGLACVGDCPRAGPASRPSPPEGGVSAFCDEHFGYGWLRRWNATAAPRCWTAEGHLPGSRVTCRSVRDEHMPAASAPHAMCDVRGLVVDTSRMTRARCPRHRPGYLCETPTYHRYGQGAFELGCDWPSFSLADHSPDHGRDIYQAMAAGARGWLSPLVLRDTAPEPRPTLFVTREVREHANLFHCLTDLLNAFLTLRMLGWQTWGVLLLDDHPPGPFDELWARLHARGGGEGGDLVLTGGAKLPPVPRLSDITGPKRPLYTAAAFPPPGYTSLLFAHLYEPSSCPHPTPLFADFRAFLLGLFDPARRTLGRPLAAAASDAFNVLVVSRRPGQGRRRVARQLANEEELVDALRALDGLEGRAVAVHLLDLAGLALEQQLARIAQTDLLVGMHGAGLAHALLARPGTALLELWPQPEGIWRCYEHFAEWAGLHYGRWANPDPSKHQKRGPTGDTTEVDVAAVAELARQLLTQVVASSGARQGS
uniref:Glycosyltransferase 61 catalytic domain-containing protein n=1 Tax=Auxenochlorella protothecoides TaxID=3075 RepID=A0A1D1ZP74_AUXPR